MFLELLLFGLTASLAFAWYIKTVRWNHWKKLGIYQVPGSIPFEEIFMTKHIADIVVSLRLSVTTFGNNLKVLGKILTVISFLAKRQFYDIIGLIVTVANGRILKNNLTIWAHWSPSIFSTHLSYLRGIIGWSHNHLTNY